MMRWVKITVLVTCLGFGARLAAQSNNDSLFNWSTISGFSLTLASGNSFTSTNIPSSGNGLSLFMFLSPECPLSKNYTRTLNKLFERYHGDVAFTGCIPGKGFTRSEISSFISTYKIAFPVVVDESKHLTQYLAARVTPEVILVDRHGVLVYKGAIDDWISGGLGQQRITVSKNYLEDAIEAAVNGRAVPVRRTTAHGCLINDY